jgi:phospholipid/cholesterol/gamma-HCH transport system substrate-binding protein
MKSFSERNLPLIGVVGVLAIAAIALGALQYNRLPFFTASKQDYSAYFADSSGLTAGTYVQVAGLRVGEVTNVRLDGSKVLISFNVDKKIRLGDRTEAAVKARSLLGAKILEITPRGEGRLSGTIPLDRTTPAYELPDALGDLAQTVDNLNTDQLNASLSQLADVFKDTPPELKSALEGVGRFTKTIDERDAQLRNLLANANKVTAVLANRTDQIVRLVANSNAFLATLQAETAALDHISGSISTLSQQLSAFIAENRSRLKPALDKLNAVLAIVDGRKDRVKEAIKLLNSYAVSLGEALSSGPFFKAYVSNLLPGQFVQPFVDAAFSDLGLDPHVLTPSQLTDPQTGQPATPALPIPYPRTGQGGDPKTTLPDAITGNPGDPGCGPPGLPLPGPTGCYPYREPTPAPAAGGPPPGPPAASPPELATTQPSPSPVLIPAPGEVAPSPAETTP